MKLLERLSRLILQRINKRTQPSYVVENGGVSYQPPGRAKRFLPFSNLSGALLHRRDVYGFDLMVLTLVFTDGTVAEFLEDDSQWATLATALDESAVTLKPSRIWLAEAIANSNCTVRDLLKV